MNYEAIFSKIPIVISVVLYNYNYIDNKIIASLKNNSFIIEKSNNQIVVPYTDFVNLLNNHFKTELNDSNIYPQDRSNHGINSAIQLDSLFTYYNNTKVVNVNISLKRTYDKSVIINNNKISAIDFIIEKGTVDYGSFLNEKQLKLLNNLFKDIGIVETLNVQSSYTIHINDYLYLIESLPNDKKNKYKEIININSLIFNDKLKIDNTVLILITDF